MFQEYFLYKHVIALPVSLNYPVKGAPLYPHLTNKETKGQEMQLVPGQMARSA